MPEVPRFSVVIPTRARPDTLAACLETCLGQRRFDAFEVVVCDNSDPGDDRTERLIAQRIAEDPRARDRIVFARQDAVRAMSCNFSDAIARASGEYVVVLGDDDGLLPMALYEIDRLVTETGEAVIRWSNGLYMWPGMAIEAEADYLGFSLLRGHRVRQGREALAECLATLRYEHLPMLYINAAVRRDVVNAMRDETGMLFHARCPDVYSAIAIAYLNSSYLDVSAPLSLAGLSRSSNGVSSAFAGSNVAPKVDFDALNRAAGLTPHPLAPDLPIFPLVALAESFLFAKAQHFPDDTAFELPRDILMRAYAAQADTADPAVRAAILDVCRGDDALFSEIDEALRNPAPRPPAIRLKPTALGFDGRNLLLDPSDFGIRDVADAVALVHGIVWPGDEPIRYDVADAGSDVVQADLVRTDLALVRANEEITALRGNLAFHREALIEAREELARVQR